MLITEVLEHMPKEDAVKLLDSVLAGEFNKVVVTMPNKDFNRFYGLSDDEMRHPDHRYEPTESEFYVWMMDAAIKNRCQVEFFNVGDRVCNRTNTDTGTICAYVSLGCVFTMKKETNV